MDADPACRGGGDAGAGRWADAACRGLSPAPPPAQGEGGPLFGGGRHWLPVPRLLGGRAAGTGAARAHRIQKPSPGRGRAQDLGARGRPTGGPPDRRGQDPPVPPPRGSGERVLHHHRRLSVRGALEGNAASPASGRRVHVRVLGGLPDPGGHGHPIGVGGELRGGRLLEPPGAAARRAPARQDRGGRVSLGGDSPGIATGGAGARAHSAGARASPPPLRDCAPKHRGPSEGHLPIPALGRPGFDEPSQHKLRGEDVR